MKIGEVTSTAQRGDSLAQPFIQRSPRFKGQVNSWFSFAGTYVNGAASSITVDFQLVASGTGNFPASLDDFSVTSNCQSR